MTYVGEVVLVMYISYIMHRLLLISSLVTQPIKRNFVLLIIRIVALKSRVYTMSHAT